MDDSLFSNRSNTTLPPNRKGFSWRSRDFTRPQAWAFLAEILYDHDPASAVAFAADILDVPNPASAVAFAAEILDVPNPASAAAFAAAILREHNFNPNEPRDERGRWTTGGSNTHGVPGTSPKADESTSPWPALPAYDADKKTGGMSHLDWLKEFAGHAVVPPSQASEKLDKAFLATLKNGCIGVAAVGAGYSDIDEFKKQLNECYWSEEKAKEALQRKKCEGARDVYGQKPCATLVAIQFASVHWTKPVPANPNAPGWWEKWQQKDFGAEPLDLSKEANWNAVNHGIEVVAVPGGNRPLNREGTFDVQFYSPRIGRWLGANNGVTEKTPDMRVFSLSDGKLKAHIDRGDKPDRGYKMHLWCVVPEKAYEAK